MEIVHAACEKEEESGGEDGAGGKSVSRWLVE